MLSLLRRIFLIDILKGLWVTLKYTPQPAFTFQYPAERRPGHRTLFSSFISGQSSL